MRAKYYLRQIRRLDNIINAKLEQIEILKSMSTKITTDLSNERVQTSVSDKLGSSVVKIVDLENELNDSIDRLIDLKSEAMKRIDSLENENYKLLLTLRYLNYKTWEQIAVEMNYSYRNIHKLHEKSLIIFEKECTKVHSEMC